MDIQKTQTSSIQQFSAVNAFKSSKQQKKKDDSITETNKEDINTVGNKSILDKIDVEDIRKCARTVGEFDITDEDIKYGLIYGRSVIAEWLC